MKRVRFLSGALALLCLLMLTACPAGGGAGASAWGRAVWDEATWQ